jgi:taurine dioxygenase
MVAVTASSSVLGARVSDADLARLDNGGFNRIHRALLDHIVLGIDRQALSAGEFSGFAGRFGTPRPHVMSQFRHPRHPEVLVLSNAGDEGKPRGLADGGIYWHSDHSYLEYPATVTAQYALEIPAGGSDTLFANMYAVYDALPDALKQRIDGLRGIHNYGYRYRQLRERSLAYPPLSAAQREATPDAIHPVVRVHPETGRRALYISPGFTVGFVGLETGAGDALKAELFDYALRPEFHYYHHWQPGDVLIWDNRCAMHCATRDYAANRTLYQVTVAGHV